MTTRARDTYTESEDYAPWFTDLVDRKDGTYGVYMFTAWDGFDDNVIYYTIYDYNKTRIIQPEKRYDGSMIVLPGSCTIVATAYFDAYIGDNEQSFDLGDMPHEEYYSIDEAGCITDYCGHETDITVPSTIDGITVTAIGSEVFDSDAISQMVSISLPDTCTEIKENAFKDAQQLKRVDATGLEIIGESAFENAYLLKYFTSDHVAAVGSRAFYRDSSLRVFDFSNVVSVGDEAFYETSVYELVSDKLTGVGISAFEKTLLEYVITPNVADVGEAAFRGDFLLRSVSLHEVTYLNAYIFRDCENLVEIDVPGFIEGAVAGHQFYNCGALDSETVNIGFYMGPVLSSMFAWTDLKYVENEYVTRVGYESFMGAPVQSVRLKNCTWVDYKAFEENDLLETVYMPKLTSYYNNSFRYKNIKTVFLSQNESFRIQYWFGKSTVDTNLYLGQSATINNYKNIKNENKPPYLATRYRYNAYIPRDAQAYSEMTTLGYTPTDTYTMVDTHCATADNNELHFNFRWKLPEELAGMPFEVRYYCEYSLVSGGETQTTNAEILQTNHSETITDFSATISDIGPAEHNIQYKAVGCVDVDGLVFKSEPVIVNYTAAAENELELDCEHAYVVAGLTADDKVQLECEECGDVLTVAFEEYINTDYAPLDMNNDGIVNAKDLAYIIKEYQCS